MYNEISTVADTAVQLTRELDDYCDVSGDTYEIIFSDDGSTDGTYDAIPATEAVGSKHGVIIPLKGEVNLGKGAAVKHAMLKSTGDLTMYTDCDLAYGTSVIPEAVNIMKTRDAQMLVGSRAIHPKGYEGYTFIRRLASKTYIRILCLLTGVRTTDSQCGFKMFTRGAADSIFALAETNGWAFDLELFLLAKRDGIKIAEMPVTIVNHRESRISVMRDSFKMLREILRIKKRIKGLK